MRTATEAESVHVAGLREEYSGIVALHVGIIYS
jgi:hypothetical protein